MTPRALGATTTETSHDVTRRQMPSARARGGRHSTDETHARVASRAASRGARSREPEDESTRARAKKRSASASEDLVPMCSCQGCAGCGALPRSSDGDRSTCSNAPQMYANKTREGKLQRGYRRLCKPCLRRIEKKRTVEKKEERKHDGTSTSTDVRARRERIVLFGDSLTERSFEDGGFGSKIQDTFRRFADVHVRGYSGYNTDHALCLLDDIFPTNDPHPPALVTVLFGSNDACAPHSIAGAVQHVPVGRYEANLTAIVARLRSLNPAPRIMFITPPPVHDENWYRECVARASLPGTAALPCDKHPNRTNAAVKPYVDAMRRVAEKNEIPCVDLHRWLLLSNGKVDETQLVDGLHFSEAGQRQVASLVIEAVAEHFPDLYKRNAASSLKSDYPDWKEFKADSFKLQIANYAPDKVHPSPATKEQIAPK